MLFHIFREVLLDRNYILDLQPVLYAYFLLGDIIVGNSVLVDHPLDEISSQLLRLTLLLLLLLLDLDLDIIDLLLLFERMIGRRRR